MKHFSDIETVQISSASKWFLEKIRFPNSEQQQQKKMNTKKTFQNHIEPSESDSLIFRSFEGLCLVYSKYVFRIFLFIFILGAVLIFKQYLKSVCLNESPSKPKIRSHCTNT